MMQILVTVNDDSAIKVCRFLDLIDGVDEYETHGKNQLPASTKTELAISLSKVVHDNCKNVPHNIGELLAHVVERNLKAGA